MLVVMVAVMSRVVLSCTRVAAAAAASTMLGCRHHGATGSRHCVHTALNSPRAHALWYGPAVCACVCVCAASECVCVLSA